VAVLVMAALVAGCRNDPPPAASSPADREAPPVRETKIPMH
jgi:hypothetical protein